MHFHKDFPLLQTQANGHPIAYLDNAATSQKPRAVIAAVHDFYESQNANIHRGVYALAEQATALYEETRERVRKFINADSTEEIIFTSGATAGINIVAQMMIENILEPGDTVVLTESEHHSNIVPWQIVGKRKGTGIKYIPVNQFGALTESVETGFKSVSATSWDAICDAQTKVLSIQYASNATGIVHPIKEIIAEAKKRGMITIVDAAQAAPHFPIDVQALGCDFLVFSGHKMFAPMGTGVLYGKKELLAKSEPILGGGDMIEMVNKNESTWAALPHKFEPGTPNVAGVVGLNAAVKYIEAIGWETIRNLEDELIAYAFERMREIKTIKLHTSVPEFKIKNSKLKIPDHLPIVPFSLSRAHPHDVATILDQRGICIRAGHHCTQLLHKAWNISASCRASLSFYNTKEEINRLMEGLREVEKTFT